MSIKVSKQFKVDFDFCMDHWKALKDGFNDDDVTEARHIVREAALDDRIEECEQWFAQEAAKIREILGLAAGINDRIHAKIKTEQEKAA